MAFLINIAELLVGAMEVEDQLIAIGVTELAKLIPKRVRDQRSAGVTVGVVGKKELNRRRRALAVGLIRHKPKAMLFTTTAVPNLQL